MRKPNNHNYVFLGKGNIIVAFVNCIQLSVENILFSLEYRLQMAMASKYGAVWRYIHIKQKLV